MKAVPETIFDTGMFSLERFDFSKRGPKKHFYRIVEPDSVAILPITASGKIVIERQYRPAIRKYVYEIPAGHAEKGERMESAAMRELKEETGYRAGLLRHMFSAYKSPGLDTELLTFFLATRLKKGKPSPDPSEIITTIELSIGNLLEMIKSNRITDAKTIAATLFYVLFLH